MIRPILFPLLLFFSLGTIAQTNNLTGSPYSLFGLGVSTNANIGKNSSLGNGGYALAGPNFINILNPASFGAYAERSFLFDFGFLVEMSNISNRSANERRIVGNFSNLALAATLSPKSSFGLAVTPYTDVGYSLIGVESNIEGSFDQFTSNVLGTGSLNDFRFSYGYALTAHLRVGVSLSYLFGTLEENEQIVADQSSLSITEQSSYNGFRLGLGLQYELGEKFALGIVANLPTALSGTQDRIVDKSLDFVPTTVENETNISLESFDLPLEINGGILLRPNDHLGINLDYGTRLWEATEQRDKVGQFIDQHILSVGAEYVVDKQGLEFWKHVEFRAGLYYDTGYLQVNDNKISSYGITAGIGIPLGYRSASRLNISYTNSSRGTTEGFLVQEHFNTININISLKDLWFLKRKIN